MFLSEALEDYLNAIYKLSINENTTRVTDISNYLKVQKPSTNNALRVLKEEGLVHYEKYKNVSLTEKGIAVAKQIHKRQKLFESFLKDVLEIDETLVKREAMKLSHCVSCHTTAKLERYIETILEKKEETTC